MTRRGRHAELRCLTLVGLLVLLLSAPGHAAPEDTQGTIAGLVVDAEGRPAAGVRVTARTMDARRWAIVGGVHALRRAFEVLPNEYVAAMTGADGRFRIPGLRDGVSYHLALQCLEPLAAAGTHATARAVAVPETHVALEPGRRIEGRLLDGKQEPVEGRLSVYAGRRSSSFIPRSAASEVLLVDEPTDDEGRFAFVAPASSWLSLHAEAAGVGARILGLDPAPGTAQVELALRLAEGCRASGLVVDGAGAPIAGALVQIGARSGSEYRSDGRVFAATRSDAEGRWSVDGLPEGWLTLAAAWAPERLLHSQPSLRAPIRLDAPYTVDFVLARGMRVEGRVLDDKGAPIAGAHVAYSRAYATGGPRPGQQTRADAQGRYVFEAVPTTPGWIQATAPGYTIPFSDTDGADHQQPSYAIAGVEPGGTLVQDLHLERGRVLTGRVVDTTGQALAGVGGTLTMSSGSPAAGGYRRQTLPLWSDEEGRFEIQGVAPDATLSLLVSAAGYAYRTIPVHLEPSGKQTTLEIVLKPATVLRGSVLDAAGAPMPHVPVGLSPGSSFSQVMTDASGRFELTSGTAGTLRLHVGHTVYGAVATLVVDVSEGGVRDGLVLRWPGAGELGGVVVDETDVPQAGVMVGVQHEKLRTLSARAWTDAEGRWRLRHVPEGRYKITLEQQYPPAAHAATGSLDVRAVLKTAQPEIIDGLVLGPTGDPVPSGTIAVARPEDGPYTQRGMAHVLGGHFRVVRPAALPGPLVLAVTDARDAQGRTYPARLGRVTVDKNTPRPVTIRLEPAGEVSGVALDADGEPVAGILLTLTPKKPVTTQSGYRSLSAYADAEGRFRFVGMAPGVHVLTHQFSAAYIQQQALEVEAGAQDVEFRIKRWRSITGIVLDLEGKPLAGAIVALGTAAHGYPRPHRGVVASDARGRFVIPRVAPTNELSVTAAPPPGYEGPAVAGTTSGVRAGDRDVLVRLRRGLTIEGVVQDLDGRPVAGCVVTTKNVRTASGARSTWYARPKATTKKDGRFVLQTFLPDLLADLSFVVPSGAPTRYFSEERKSIASGRKDVVVRMEAGVMIRGEVHGVPVELLKGLRLSASPAEEGMRPVSAGRLMNGSAATFEIGPLKPGPHKIRLSMRSSGGRLFYPREVRAEAPAKGVVINVERAWYLHGRVLTKNPRGYVVEFHPPEGRKLVATVAGTDGVFRLGRLRDHAGQLLVRMRGSNLVALLEGVKPSAGPVEVELAEGRTIAGRVTDLPEKMRSARITARRGSVVITGPIAEDGWFETPQLPPGTWQLEINASRPRRGTYLAPPSVKAGAKNVLIRYRSAR